MVRKHVRGVPLRCRPPRGPKVTLNVVLGRATRACVIHITGITCEGVAVSSDVLGDIAPSAQSRMLPQGESTETARQTARSNAE